MRMQIYETQWDFGTSRRYSCKSKSRGWAYRQETHARVRGSACLRRCTRDMH